jgi:ribonuclease-3
MEQERLEACQEALQYRFREPFWLQKALSHSSNRSDLGLSNERMEFLGDAILGMVVSDYLFTKYPEADEGELTAVKSIVVSQRTLADHSRQIGLDKFLSVGRGMSGVRRLPNSVVANVFEAIVAGIYLDRGIDAVREFILRNLDADIEEAERTKHETNYKSLLQQLAQRELACTPTYRVVEEAGPDHAKSFRVVTILRDVEYGTGWGRNKKEAEQRSAKESLDLLRAQLDAIKPPAAEAPEGPPAAPEPAQDAAPEPAPAACAAPPVAAPEPAPEACSQTPPETSAEPCPPSLTGEAPSPEST